MIHGVRPTPTSAVRAPPPPHTALGHPRRHRHLLRTRRPRQRPRPRRCRCSSIDRCPISPPLFPSRTVSETVPYRHLDRRAAVTESTSWQLQRVDDPRGRARHRDPGTTTSTGHTSPRHPRLPPATAGVHDIGSNSPSYRRRRPTTEHPPQRLRSAIITRPPDPGRIQLAVTTTRCPDDTPRRRHSRVRDLMVFGQLQRRRSEHHRHRTRGLGHPRRHRHLLRTRRPRQRPRPRRCRRSTHDHVQSPTVPPGDVSSRPSRTVTSTRAQPSPRSTSWQLQRVDDPRVDGPAPSTPAPRPPPVHVAASPPASAGDRRRTRHRRELTVIPSPSSHRLNVHPNASGRRSSPGHPTPAGSNSPSPPPAAPTIHPGGVHSVK